jgi:dCMP deaminase
MATGYNGVPRGIAHCNITQCPGMNAVSGTNLDGSFSHSSHAEQNALLQCRNVEEIESIYITTSPCITCTKLLLNTSCDRIVFLEEYTQPGIRELWRKAGRVWIHMPLNQRLQVQEMFRNQSQHRGLTWDRV